MDDVLLAFFVGAFAGWVLRWLFGNDSWKVEESEWKDHRQVCPCAKCNEWRREERKERGCES
jgi:hypothetical protein